MLARYYIFNMMYEKSSNASLVFLQKYMLQISDEIPTPKKVATLMTRINGTKDGTL